MPGNVGWLLQRAYAKRRTRYEHVAGCHDDHSWVTISVVPNGPVSHSDEVLLTMSYQYCFCPACGVRRAAYDFRCSVCEGVVRRTPVSFRTAPTLDRAFLKWSPIVLTDAALGKRQPPAARNRTLR